MDMLGPVLKEWYWLLIIGSIFALAFAPSILKGKCPTCKKRGMRSVEVDDYVLRSLSDNGMKPFTSFHRCEKCSGRFIRERSGPFEDGSSADWNNAFDGKHPS